MFNAIEMIGDDLRWRAAVVAPTIKIAEMTIAGAYCCVPQITLQRRWSLAKIESAVAVQMKGLLAAL